MEKYRYQDNLHGSLGYDENSLPKSIHSEENEEIRLASPHTDLAHRNEELAITKIASD